jgi:nitrate/nitrite transporter NarK
MNAKATRPASLSMFSVPARALHLAAMVFFVCFFPWLAFAALSPLLRDELPLPKDQFASHVVAVSVMISVVAIFGRICGRFGVRAARTWMLALGAVLIIGIAATHSL